MSLQIFRSSHPGDKLNGILLFQIVIADQEVLLQCVTT